MNEKIMKAMVATGVVKKIDIVASGGHFHIEANTPNGPITAETQKGKVKTWVSLDAAAKWVRSLGIGSAHLKLANWQPGQREIDF
jgi:hypothetical protein